MAIERNPNDPYATTPLDDDRAARTREDLDIASASEPAVTGGRVVLFAGAIVVALGLVFYGMNMTSTGPNQAVNTSPQTAPANQTAQQNAPAVRDVTPSNTQPGMTTGSAPARPATPAPADGSTGSTR